MSSSVHPVDPLCFCVARPAALPHWSEVSARARPSPTIATVLGDLVSWAADLAVILTHHCPDDRAAIEQVRRYALAWLAGEPTAEVRIEDVLTTAATLMSAIDLDLGRANHHQDDDERHAVGAALVA